MFRRKDVELKTGLSRSTIYKYCSNGYFPKPVKLGPSTRSWIEKDVDEWTNNLQKIPFLSRHKSQTKKIYRKINAVSLS